jgi:hypothetical protein
MVLYIQNVKKLMFVERTLAYASCLYELPARFKQGVVKTDEPCFNKANLIQAVSEKFRSSI